MWQSKDWPVSSSSAPDSRCRGNCTRNKKKKRIGGKHKLNARRKAPLIRQGETSKVRPGEHEPEASERPSGKKVERKLMQISEQCNDQAECTSSAVLDTENGNKMKSCLCDFFFALERLAARSMQIKRNAHFRISCLCWFFSLHSDLINYSLNEPLKQSAIVSVRSRELKFDYGHRLTTANSTEERDRKKKKENFHQSKAWKRVKRTFRRFWSSIFLWIVKKKKKYKSTSCQTNKARSRKRTKVKWPTALCPGIHWLLDKLNAHLDKKFDVSRVRMWVCWWPDTKLRTPALNKKKRQRMRNIPVIIRSIATNWHMKI